MEVPKVEFFVDEYIEMVLKSTNTSDPQPLFNAINKVSSVVMPLIGDDPRIVRPLERLQSVVHNDSDASSGISEAVDVLQGMLDCIRDKMWVKPVEHRMARVLDERARDGELDRWHWRIWNNILLEIVGNQKMLASGGTTFEIDVEGIARLGGGKKWWIPLKELAVQEAIDDFVRWGLIAPMPRIDENDASPAMYVIHPQWV